MATSVKRPDYEEDVDFKALALQDTDFAKVLNANKGYLDFYDPEAVKQLTKSLLKRDFELTFDLPDDRLCPPVPVRYNYVRWIQDLIDTTSPTYTDIYDPNRCVTGLDIGTGASAIYALLLLRTRPSWLICGTDIDSASLSHATTNVKANNLLPRMRLLQTSSSDPLIPLSAIGLERLDFTICNPPFFSSAAEMQDSLRGEGKMGRPSAVCTGAEVEMVTPGGDLGFVLRMVEESRILRDKVQWYSSMLGKLSSVNALVAKLKVVGVTNWAVCSLLAGRKTRRWAVAWSWGDMRPRNDVARRGLLAHDILPFPTEYHIPITKNNGKVVAAVIDDKLEPLDLRWIWKEDRMAGVGLAAQNVWSRSVRRKKKREEKMKEADADEMDEDEEEEKEDRKVALGFKISVTEQEVQVRWLQGRDQVLYESFCGMLKRVVDGIAR